jgi:hypothetical protein
MYRQPSKRKIIIQRVVVYSLMTVAVFGLVTVLVFVMLGYQYNGNDGKIEQGGLVQFDSQPTGADIIIDGAKFGTRTTSRATMTSGPHTIVMQDSGYQTWQKSINVVPGSVLWLNYTRLIPKTLTPVNEADFSAMSSTAASKDGKWMAVKDVASTPTIKLFDLSNDTVQPKEITLPLASYTASSDANAQTFSFDSWDTEGRFLLVKHTYDTSKVEWLVVDTQDVSATKNVTTLLGIDASKLVFSNNDSNILYAQIDQEIRKIDLNAATLSRPLVTNVADFSLYSDSMINFSTAIDPITKTRSVGYYIDGADTPRTIQMYTDDGSAPLHLAVGKYFGDTIEGISYGSTVQVLKGNLPRDNTPLALKPVTTITAPGGVQYLSSMTNGRFIVAQSGATYVTYDIELNKTTTTTLKGAADVTKKIEWLDEYTLIGDRDGTVRLYEFDGANQHDIMPVAPGFSITLTPNEKYLYGITKTATDSYHLTRVRLILS